MRHHRETKRLVLTYFNETVKMKRGRVAQLVTCLAADTCLTTDPGVASLIPVRYHTFVEIDHEIISTVIPLIKEGLLSVTSESMCTKYWLTVFKWSSFPRKKVWFGELTVPT